MKRRQTSVSISIYTFCLRTTWTNVPTTTPTRHDWCDNWAVILFSYVILRDKQKNYLLENVTNLFSLLISFGGRKKTNARQWCDTFIYNEHNNQPRSRRKKTKPANSISHLQCFFLSSIFTPERTFKEKVNKLNVLLLF